MNLSILYRGPLESCNYGCEYCPFAKKVDSRADLEKDERALERFVDWVAARTQDRIGIFITPWGEGLIRPHYQRALARLSNMPHVDRAAIQTNLSCTTDWIDTANKKVLALWATYHPEWITREKFVSKVRALHERGVRLSCGVVGFKRFTDEIEALRRELPEGVYLWINAAKRMETYSEEDIVRFERIDPLFRTNTREHPSLGKSCRAGASVVSVDGEGDVRRCHFIKDVIGNLYDGSFDASLKERPCTNATCGCHIGYVHMDDLEMHRVFGEGILERIPMKRQLAIV